MENNEFKILIVDDEDDILEFVGYNLRKEGYQVLTSNNGRDAIKLAREKLPHLIILDVMMPEMDGIETCREMRNTSALNQTIITFFTARNEDYSLIAGFDAGADDYITKPIKPRVLTSKVNALLRQGQAVASVKGFKGRPSLVTYGKKASSKERGRPAIFIDVLGAGPYIPPPDPCQVRKYVARPADSGCA